MARLPYVDPATAPPEVREALEAIPPLNIFRTLAHAAQVVAKAGRPNASVLLDALHFSRSGGVPAHIRVATGPSGLSRCSSRRRCRS